MGEGGGELPAWDAGRYKHGAAARGVTPDYTSPDEAVAAARRSRVLGVGAGTDGAAHILPAFLSALPG